jgi:ABC-type antimicrobial peptide transport system permease subunit
VGLYGVMAYSVSQRTREIGLRLALGATTGDVLRLVFGQGLLLTVAGLALGLTAAALAAQLIAGLLYDVGATDPLTFVVIPVVLTAVAALAIFIPARRASRVDPVIALRAG